MYKKNKARAILFFKIEFIIVIFYCSVLVGPTKKRLKCMNHKKKCWSPKGQGYGKEIPYRQCCSMLAHFKG